jgi:hypothetical protein
MNYGKAIKLENLLNFVLLYIYGVQYLDCKAFGFL